MNKIISRILFFVLIGLFNPVIIAKIDPNLPEYELFHKDLPTFPFADFYPLEEMPIDICTQPKITRATPQKPWTFMVYMAADNDLRAFAANNIKQMCSIGSNQHINILIHLDIRLNGNQKITRRYFIEKNKIVPMDEQATAHHMDSGDPKTLITFCDWAIKNYPAQHYALILWNHGTGIIDPKYYKVINPTDLFMFNPSTHRHEIDRSIGFLDLLAYKRWLDRGICMDSSTGNYLNNQNLESAFGEICSRILKNKKFDLIGFDACLMSMIEVAEIFEKYADVMVGSQEVELGTGWNYTRVLEPFATKQIDKVVFADHIVNSYTHSYRQITNDYTQSAINLAQTHQIRKNIDAIGRILVECLQNQQNNSVRVTIKSCRNKKICTSFDEPSYTDLHNFYHNLRENLPKMKVNTPKMNLLNELNRLLSEGMKLITSTVFSNSAGKNLARAKGLSIYFPENRIHQSYFQTTFAKTNHWAKFLSAYLG